MCFEKIPNVVCVEIFQYLDFNDLAKIARVSKRYNLVINQKCNQLWKRIFSNIFPDSYRDHFAAKNEKNNFKELCYEQVVTIPNNIKAFHCKKFSFEFKTGEFTCHGNRLINCHFEKEKEIEIVDIKDGKISKTTHKSTSLENQTDFMSSHQYKNYFLSGFQESINIIDVEKESNDFLSITNFNLTGNSDNLICTFDCFEDKIYILFWGGMVKSFYLKDLISCTNTKRVLTCLDSIEPREAIFWNDEADLPCIVREKYLYQIEGDGIHFWNLEKSKKVGVIEAIKSDYTCPIIYIKNNRVFFENNENEVTMWDLDNCKKLNPSFKSFNEADELLGMKLYDDRLFCAYDQSNQEVNITVWDVKTGKKIGILAHPQTINDFQYCNNKLFISNKSTDTLTIYDFSAVTESVQMKPNNPSLKKRKRDL